MSPPTILQLRRPDCCSPVTLNVQGSKNIFLHLAAVPLLGDFVTVRLNRTPDITDRKVVLSLLSSFGLQAAEEANTVILNGRATTPTMDQALGQLIRPTLCFGTAAAISLGQCLAVQPGGDAFTLRPTNVHLAMIRAAKGTVDEVFTDGVKRLLIKFPRGPQPFVASALTPYGPSLGGTVTGLLVAATVQGDSTITHASREPEVIATAELLRALKVHIDVDESLAEINVTGIGRALSGAASVDVPADRMEAGTYLLIGLLLAGAVSLEGISLDDMPAGLHDALQRAGVGLIQEGSAIRAKLVHSRPIATYVETGVHPAFPTDLQPPFAAFLSQAVGASTLVENVYDRRLTHITELRKLGLGIEVIRGNQYIVGPQELHGGLTAPSDIRCAASVLTAAAANRQVTEIIDYGHLRRGYSDLNRKLETLGFEISQQRLTGRINSAEV